MSASSQHSWLPPAILIGVLYSVVGVVFGLPTNHVRMWRLAAWVVSGVVFAAHIGYEHFRLHSSPGKTALHAALGVALGGFGLAVAANIHEVWFTPGYRRSLAAALVAWPIITALPAFVIALITAYGLTLIRKRS